MLTEYYRHFLAVVELETISAAARKCALAQPTLSNQIKLLEQEYGAPLLERGVRRATLTEAGRIVYEKAQRICQLERQALEEVRCARDGSEGTLTLALPPSNNSVFLRGLLARFLAQHPAIRLELFELSAAQVAQYVRDGLADIGFLRAPVPRMEQFDRIPAPPETLSAVLRREHPLARYDRLPVARLDGCALALSRSWLDVLRALAQTHGIHPVLRTVATSRTVAVEMARIQNLVAVVPVGEGDALPDGMVLRPIDGIAAEVARSFITRKGRPLSTLAAAFLRLSQQQP